jgi:hypothetical protein
LQGSVFSYDDVMGVLKVIVYVVFPFTYLNFTNGGVSAAGCGMTHYAGLSSRVCVLGVKSSAGILSSGMISGQRVSEEWSIPPSTSTLHVIVMVGGCFKLREGYVKCMRCECCNGSTL